MMTTRSFVQQNETIAVESPCIEDRIEDSIAVVDLAEKSTKDRSEMLLHVCVGHLPLFRDTP